MSPAGAAHSGEAFPHIAGYQIEAVLGRGTTGVVYRARQLSVDREVALKVLHPELVRNPRSVKRLQREARTAARLAHPNLISSIDMGETAGTWWFAMELVHGEALSSRLERVGRLSEREALPIFIKLCEALQHASQKSVVHRDIKPANILLEEGDNPRLVDLGLARVEDDPMLTRTGATLGTPHYISPEQARDPALADVRSDIWSLGATLFHTVCGQPPFTGTATAEILSGVLYGAIPNPAELRPELSKGLVLVLRKCLSRDPARRYHNPGELDEDLRRVQAHKPPAIKRSALEPLDPGRKLERRQSALAAGGVAAAVLVALVLLVWRPWSSAGTASPLPTRVEARDWPQLTQLRVDVEGGGLLLRDAWVELEGLRPATPREALPQWNELQDLLLRELEKTLYDVYGGGDEELARLLAAHDFSGARQYVESGFGLELGTISGFAGPTLPRERDRAQFVRFVETRRDQVEAQRVAALGTAARRIEQWASEVLFPQLDRLQAAGSWTEARELLERAPAELWAESGADLRGLDGAALRERLRGLVLELEARSQRLERDWFALDSRTLRKGIGDLADGLEARLRSRELLRAGEELELGFEALLVTYRLDRETLDVAPEQHSLAYLAERRAALRELEETLLERDALARLAELDAEAEGLLSARRYEEALAFWQAHLQDPSLEPQHDLVSVRVEEAEELLAFLLRAAESVRGLEGSEVSLKQGSIVVKGKVGLRGAPLESGFRVMISTTSGKDYLLRSTEGERGEVLEQGPLEQLAIRGAELELDLGLLKQRALFRFHEGDLEGAAKLLRAEQVTDAELLIYDLGLRVARGLGREQDLAERRRAYARVETDRLTQPQLPQGDAQRVVLQLSRLLREYADVLDPAQEARLRAKRERLEQGSQPSTRAEFQAEYGPDEVRFWAQDKVGMSFRFDQPEVGEWELGDWVYNGNDSWRGVPISDLAALEGAAVPTLMLRDPLLLDEGTTTLTLRLRQPVDSPPELLVISALGFHVACVGPRVGRKPLVLADTTGLLDVAERACEGKGVEFGGLGAGAEHSLTLRLSRASGKVVVLIDGVQVLTANRVSPQDQPRSRSLSLRAFEPVELLEVQLEGTRR